MASRGSFDSRLGFILASAGSAVGLGNIWQFPFRTGENGGAAFVFVYLIACFVLAYPVMVAEIAIGRSTQRNAVGAFSALGFKKWRLIGYLGVGAGILILSFYNVVAAWAFGYFVDMVIGRFDVGGHFDAFTRDWLTVGLYAIGFMAATAYVVSRGVSGGIERAAKILMPALLVFIVGLVIYSLTLPDAMTGLKFYLSPDFSKINGTVIYKALGQAFFSLSLGMGALITYGSYVSRKTNIVSAAAIITLTDVTVAVLAGLMMFPFVAYLTHGDIAAMTKISGGPGFIFQTLPGIFQTLGPALGEFVGAVFFLLLSFAAFTSTISLLEVPTAYLVDERKIPRRKATWMIAALIFVVGIPSMLSTGTSEFFTHFINMPSAQGGMVSRSFMDFVGIVASDTVLPLGGFLISVFVAYVWRMKNFNEEIATGDEGLRGSWLQSYVDFMISYVCPLILGAMVVVTVFDSYFGIDLLT